MASAWAVTISGAVEPKVPVCVNVRLPEVGFHMTRVLLISLLLLACSLAAAA